MDRTDRHTGSELLETTQTVRRSGTLVPALVVMLLLLLSAACAGLSRTNDGNRELVISDDEAVSDSAGVLSLLDSLELEADSLWTDLLWDDSLGTDTTFGYGGLGMTGTGRGGGGAASSGLGTVGTLGSGGGKGRGYGSGSGSGASTNDDSGIVRFPTMESPSTVSIGAEFAVVVSLTTEEFTPEVRVQLGDTTAEGALVLDLPDDADQWAIDVTLSASGFQFRDGMNAGSIILPREGDSTPALFRMTALPFEGGGSRAKKVLATFWYNGGYLARVVRDITVAGKESGVAGRAGSSPARDLAAVSQSMQGQEIGAVGGATVPPATGASMRSALSFDRSQPDLTMMIMYGLDESAPGEGTLIIESPHFAPKPHSVTRPVDLDMWLSDNYAKFSGLRARGAARAGNGRSRENSRFVLTGFGRQLFELTPPAFRQAFWTLADKLGDDFDSIQIYTDDPAFPWELVRPVREDGSDERDFLGLEFAIGRWHVAHSGRQLERPPQGMEISSLVVFAPEYEGRMQLPGQVEELAMLEKISGFKRWPGLFTVMPRLFRQLPDGIIHFSGHGVVDSEEGRPPRSMILLEDGELDLMAWRGMTTRRPRAHPFFFFNACEVGQSGAVASFVDGWAPAVLDAGASGYVGALWPIGDVGAARFASHFYTTLEERLATGPVAAAELLKESRRLFIEEADPTYLAYVFYGDPSFEFLPR